MPKPADPDFQPAFKDYFQFIVLQLTPKVGRSIRSSHTAAVLRHGVLSRKLLEAVIERLWLRQNLLFLTQDPMNCIVK